MYVTFDNYVGILSRHKLSMRIACIWFKSMRILSRFIQLWSNSLKWKKNGNNSPKPIRWKNLLRATLAGYRLRCANCATLNQLNEAFVCIYIFNRFGNCLVGGLRIKRLNQQRYWIVTETANLIYVFSWMFLLLLQKQKGCFFVFVFHAINISACIIHRLHEKIVCACDENCVRRFLRYHLSILIKLKKSLGCDSNRNRVKWFAADRSQFICYFWAFIQSKHKIIRRSLKTNENYMLLIWAKLLIEINLKMKWKRRTMRGN